MKIERARGEYSERIITYNYYMYVEFFFLFGKRILTNLKYYFHNEIQPNEILKCKVRAEISICDEGSVN